MTRKEQILKALSELGNSPIDNRRRLILLKELAELNGNENEEE